MRTRINSELNLSENRLLSGKSTQTLASDGHAQNTEAQVRQALEHMGGSRPAVGQGFHGSGRPGASPAAPRHRYVRDGEVPVVHATLGRASGRPEAPAPQEKAALEALRLDVERERSAREAAERALHETRSAMTALQTRLAHAEMDLQAAQEQVALAFAPSPPPVAPITHAVAPPAASRTLAVTAPARRKARTEKRSGPAPQPVKWWVKAEKT